MDFTNANNALQTEAGRFGGLIGAKLIATDIWNRLIRQDQFPEGMGDVIQSIIWERTVIPDVSDDAWADLRVNDGTGNTCIPTPQQLEYARTIRQYGLSQASVETPFLCVEDIRFGYKFASQLEQMYKLLDQNTTNFWSNRYRNQFLKHAGHHIVTDVADVYSMTETGTGLSFPNSQAQFKLDQGMLDTWYVDLRHDTAEGAYAMVDGQPQFALILSMEQSELLKKQNADTRQDLRFSSYVDELVKPFGVGWSHGNFIHLVDIQVPRFNFVGGSYVRVPFYGSEATTVGNQSKPSAAYRQAQFEVTFIFNPNVYLSRVPSVITNPGGGVNFPACNYRGEFNWINNKDNDKNPLGKNGYFRADFVQGSEPQRVEFGYAILHQRCGPAVAYESCS